MKKILFLVFLLISIKVVSQTYKNPIISGFHPDPSICRVGEDYYLVNSSFSYFPGVPVHHSKDLIHWKQIGYCLDTESKLPLGSAGLSGGIWAPTIRFHLGKYYMVTTNMDAGGHFICSAINPAGPWSDPVWIEKNGIDPSLFFDEDGKCYFTRNGKDDYGQEGIVQYEIDPNTGKKLSKARVISHGVFDQHAEGPHLYKIGHYYYLLLAEGGTHVGHTITISRSRDPYGPFESCPSNPILTHGNKLFEHIQATGHGDLLQDHRGNWWIVFLGIRNFWGLPVKHNLGRETFLAPVTWKDGWPIINEGKPIREIMTANLLPQSNVTPPPIKDDFTSAKLNLCWNFLRNPSLSSWSLAEKKGFLTLKGSRYTLDSVASPAFVGRRQEHHWSKFTTRVDFDPVADHEEAGITIYAADRYHYDMAIVKRNGKRQLIIRRSIDDIRYDAKILDLNEGSVTLEIKSNPWAYEFWYTQGSKPMEKLYHAQSRLLSSEVSGGFVGNYYGLYATGNGMESSTPAYYDWVEYGEFKE